jgi:polar amino acid transport system substrate-binding protein
MGATSWLAQLQKLSADYCVKKGLKPIALSVYTTDPQTTQALLSRAVDAQITDAAVARGWWKSWATGWRSPLTP